MAFVTVTEAAELSNVSRGTIYNKIEAGELSRSPEGIDTNELIRVFGGISIRQKRLNNQSIDDTQNANKQPDDIAQALLARLNAADEEKKWLRDQLEQREKLLREREAALTALLPAPGEPTDLELANKQIGRYQEQIEQLQAKINAPFWRRMLSIS